MNVPISILFGSLTLIFSFLLERRNAYNRQIEYFPDPRPDFPNSRPRPAPRNNPNLNSQNDGIRRPISSYPSSSRNQTHSTRSCGMCKKPFLKVVEVIPCSHKFHTDCITEWLKQQRNCPCCRGSVNITIEVIQQNYLYVRDDSTDSNNSQSNSTDSCVCLESLNPIELPCGHTFHEDCVKEWLDQSRVCPTCGQQCKVDKKNSSSSSSSAQKHNYNHDETSSQLNPSLAQINNCDSANNKYREKINNQEKSLHSNTLTNNEHSDLENSSDSMISLHHIQKNYDNQDDFARPSSSSVQNDDTNSICKPGPLNKKNHNWKEMRQSRFPATQKNNRDSSNNLSLSQEKNLDQGEESRSNLPGPSKKKNRNWKERRLSRFSATQENNRDSSNNLSLSQEKNLDQGEESRSNLPGPSKKKNRNWKERRLSRFSATQENNRDSSNNPPLSQDNNLGQGEESRSNLPGPSKKKNRNWKERRQSPSSATQENNRDSSNNPPLSQDNNLDQGEESRSNLPGPSKKKNRNWKERRLSRFSATQGNNRDSSNNPSLIQEKNLDQGEESRSNLPGPSKKKNRNWKERRQSPSSATQENNRDSSNNLSLSQEKNLDQGEESRSNLPGPSKKKNRNWKERRQSPSSATQENKCDSSNLSLSQESSLNLVEVSHPGLSFEQKNNLSLNSQSNDSEQNEILHTASSLLSQISNPFLNTDRFSSKDPCMLCHEISPSNFIKLRCTHDFHENCITDWLNNNRTCPFCRCSVEHLFLYANNGNEMYNLYPSSSMPQILNSFSNGNQFNNIPPLISIQLCLLCNEQLSNFIELKPCTHRFHEDCISNWLDQTKTCPFCRLPI